MTPPPPASCQVPECNYKTRENLPSHELILKDLSLHVQMVHIIPSQQAAPVAPPRTRPAQIHIRANAATAEGSKMDMALTVNMVEAKECGEQDAESLQKSSSVNRLSDYKKAQGSGLRDNQVEANVKFENRAASGDDVCRYCCQKGHGSGSNQKVREKFCPAFGKVCGKCRKLDHFKQACLRKRDGAGGDVKKTEGEIAVIGVDERSSEDEGGAL